MTYVILSLSDHRLKNRPTKNTKTSICKNRKIAESKQTKYELFREKLFPKVSLLGDKGDTYNAEVNSSITFKLKLT